MRTCWVWVVPAKPLCPTVLLSLLVLMAQRRLMACTAMNTPSAHTPNAEAIGRRAIKPLFRLMRPNKFLLYTINSPIPVSTEANPRLKATINSRPSATRCEATATSNTTSAEGHGKMPPVMPSASRLPLVTF